MARPSKNIFAVSLCAVVAIGLVTFAPTNAFANDEWFGIDKGIHFGVSAAIAGGGYAASSMIFERPWARATSGALLALTAGAAKETYDALGYGDPSWRDFTWDIIGTAVGVGISLAVDAIVSSPSSPTTASLPHDAPNALRVRF